MLILRLFLTIAWLATAFATLQAISYEGLDMAGDIFFSDLIHQGWHGQFSVDFLSHLLLIGFWAAWRQGFSLAACALAVLCVVGGGLFSFAYIILLSFNVNEDPKQLLLGKRLTST